MYETYSSRWSNIVLDLDVDKDGGIGKFISTVSEVDVAVTRHYALYWEGVRPDEIVLVAHVLVHHFDPQESKLWEVHYKLEGLLPLGVEPCNY